MAFGKSATQKIVGSNPTPRANVNFKSGKLSNIVSGRNLGNLPL